jgi:hypothetical protein
MQSGYQKTADKDVNPEVDYEAQRAARNAIMEIKESRDFAIMFRRATGYGPHVEMMQQFVFWFHPRHPKMQDRWTLWKTYEEWMDECALSEKQVRKGRKILAEKNLITHKRGQYSRIFYWVDWTELARVMGIDFIHDGITGEYGDEESDHDPWFDDPIHDPIASDFIHDGITDGFIHDGNTVDLNTEDHAGDHFQDSSLLQRAAEPSCEEPAAQEIDREKEQERVQEQPIADNVSSQNGHAQGTTTAGQEDGRGTVVAIMPPKPEDDALLAEIRAVLNPDNSGWCNAWWVRTHRPDYYTPQRIAYFLSIDEDLPRYEGRAEELEPYVAFVLWQESREGAAA